ncbi:MAG: hypothetical protein IKH58_10285 [Bacteroidales bacterium]|nr:hypothetical protein [Bacteroidales bacterium]
MEQDSTLLDFGINLLEEEIDDVIFRTNEFLTTDTFIGDQGPFWWLVQMSMALSVIFTLIYYSGMGYRMILKHEPLDVMKLFRPFAISLVLTFWYPPTKTGMAGGNVNDCILDYLAFIPNAIGSYTHDLYEAEAVQVEGRAADVQRLMFQLREDASDPMSSILLAFKAVGNLAQESSVQNMGDADALLQEEQMISKAQITTLISGIIQLLDQIIMFAALVIFRIGWWSTIYAQQILLGLLTIFGPIQWAFSLLHKFENAWMKWIMRYLTVHLYGAMLYFVGFYVLLLFDIVLNIQYNDLAAVVADNEATMSYLKNSFLSTGYLMAASCVAVKCLSMVPDLAAWILPEGEAVMSVRAFSEGVTNSLKSSMHSMGSTATRMF